jgi:hypothetical protein
MEILPATCNGEENEVKKNAFQMHGNQLSCGALAAGTERTKYRKFLFLIKDQDII